MMNSNGDVSPEKILNQLFTVLNNERIAKEIDEPIEQAAHTFRIEVTIPIDHLKFNQVIAAFIVHLYGYGISLPRCLCEKEALAEAVFLLEKHYRNEGAQGYEKALLDAIGTDVPGFERVLYQLTDAVKTVERKKYIQGVFAHHFFSLDWKVKRHIVSFYLKQHQIFLQTPLIDLNPARLVDHFFELLLHQLSDDHLINQVLGGPVMPLEKW